MKPLLGDKANRYEASIERLDSPCKFRENRLKCSSRDNDFGLGWAEFKASLSFEVKPSEESLEKEVMKGQKEESH